MTPEDAKTNAAKIEDALSKGRITQQQAIDAYVLIGARVALADETDSRMHAKLSAGLTAVNFIRDPDSAAFAQAIISADVSTPKDAMLVGANYIKAVGSDLQTVIGDVASSVKK